MPSAAYVSDMSKPCVVLPFSDLRKVWIVSAAEHLREYSCSGRAEACERWFVQDPDGHSLWDLTWYKAHAISANLTPSLLAESGLGPGLPAMPEGAAARESAADQQPHLHTLPEEDQTELLSGSEEVPNLSALPVGTPASAPVSSEPG